MYLVTWLPGARLSFGFVSFRRVSSVSVFSIYPFKTLSTTTDTPHVRILYGGVSHDAESDRSRKGVAISFISATRSLPPRHAIDFER